MILRLTKISFLILIFSLAFLQPNYTFLHIKIPFTDLLFLCTFGLWILAILFKQTQFRWHNFNWLLLLYFLTMFFSAVFSENLSLSFIRLMGGAYLVTLPILTFNLVETENFTKRTLQIWLAGTSIAVIVGILTIICFYLDRNNWLLNYTLFHFGTLPPGNYPRIQSTFINANMLCNYFSISLMILLITQKLGWIDKRIFYPLLAGILVCSLFTFSPGLGGILLSLGIWYWVDLKTNKRFLAFASLICGVLTAILFFVAGLIAPNIYPTAPFVVHVPLIDKSFAPSVRYLTWSGAFETFMNHPGFGVGLGLNVCDVQYLSLSDVDQRLTDAHNLFLSIAAQTGILGLLVICAICFVLARRLFPIVTEINKPSILRIGLAIAFVSGFIYQGLTGSFEDTRHLWVLIGLCLLNFEFPLEHFPLDRQNSEL